MITFDSIIGRRSDVPSTDHDVKETTRSLRRGVIAGD